MTVVHALGHLGPDVSVVQVQLRGKGGLPTKAWHQAPWIGDKNAAHGHGSTQTTGKMFVAESERETSFVGFTDALKLHGYTLVHVGKRVVNTEDGKTQHVLRYTFGTIPRKEKHLHLHCQELTREFEAYAAEALWNVQAFRNPYYRAGNVVEGQRVITIDINARKPLFEMKEGKLEPVAVWSGGRDKMGKGVGKKVRLTPKAFLGVSKEGEIAILVNKVVDIETPNKDVPTTEREADSNRKVWSHALREEDALRAVLGV